MVPGMAKVVKTPEQSLSPRVHALDHKGCQAIHAASLEILEQTGCHVPVPEARSLLGDAGARVDGDRVRIPAHLVEHALANLTPVTLYDRLGRPALPLASGRVTFGSLVDTFYVLDLESRRARPFQKADQAWLATVLDALPNIDWLQCVGQAHDVPENLQTQMAVAQTIRHSVKPILVYPYNRKGLLDVLGLGEIIAGGSDAFRSRPFLFFASVPAAPLSGTAYNLEILLACAEYQVPVVYYNCPAIGGNSPCSLAGTLALANADWLSAVVIHQLKRPGAPFCSGGFTLQTMDMRTTLWAYSAPEAQHGYAAIADLAHGYGLPAWGLEMNCDTPAIDLQAGLELGTNCLWGMLSGVELVHNSGMIGGGKLCSAEAFVLADEIIGFTRASLQARPAADQSLAELSALVDSVGPGGQYVSHPHTLEHFRDFWYPSILDRSNFDPLSDRQGPSLTDRLNARAQQITTSHEPAPLPDDVLREIDRIEAGWLKTSSKGGSA
jgi:trimethylamine--corrinoid protein Co-methyltransferase